MAQTRKRKANRSGKGASKQPLVSVRKPDSRRFLIFGGAGIVAIVAIIAVVVIAMTNNAASDSNNPLVVMETSEGNIKIELFQDKAPITVKNFLQYVDNKHYDGTIFHRVMKNFMIQTGGFDTNLEEKPTRETIQNESGNGLLNERGTLAMARTPQPHSASSQFFVNVTDNPFLNKANADDGWGYAVFGKVIEGMDVVDAIRAVQTDIKVLKSRHPVSGALMPGDHENVPVENVVVKSIRRLEE